VNEIVIGCCKDDHPGAYWFRDKRIVVGAVRNNYYWRDILTKYQRNQIAVGFLLVMVHEIGHAIMGTSEKAASEFMRRITNGLYEKELSWPKEDDFEDLLKMVVKERMI
jgi:hypothetical protein